MSQAGGPNSAGSVNIDFTGNVAPLEQAAKKAEQTVQQSAEKMQQSVNQAAAGGAAGGGGAAPYMPGENFGPQYTAQFEQVTQATNKAAAASTAWHTGVVAGARSILGPIRQAIGVFVSLGSIFGLVAGAGYAVYQMFTAQSRAAAASKKEVEGLRKELEGLFTSKPQTGIPAEVQERAEIFAAIEKQRKFDSESFAKYREGSITRGQLLASEADSKKLLEGEIANIQARYLAEKTEAEKNSIIAYTNMRQKAEYDLARTIAANESGALGATLEAVAEEQNARATLKDQELSNRLLAIDLELQRKLAAIKAEEDEQGRAIKERVNKEADAAQRVRDIWTGVWRDVAREQVGAFGIGGMALDPRVGDALELRARQNYTPPRVIGGI
jgi:hypothetical protein